jgi:hypothetical protein
MHNHSQLRWHTPTSDTKLKNKWGLCFCPTGYKSGFCDPLLMFDNLLERLTEFWETLDLGLPAFHKGYYRGYRCTARWTRLHKAGPWAQCSHTISGVHCLQKPPCVQLSGCSLDPVPLGLGFMEASLRRNAWLPHWPLVIRILPSPEVGEWSWKFYLSNHVLFFLEAT